MYTKRRIHILEYKVVMIVYICTVIYGYECYDIECTHCHFPFCVAVKTDRTKRGRKSTEEEDKRRTDGRRC